MAAGAGSASVNSSSKSSTPTSRVTPPLDTSWKRVERFNDQGPTVWLRQKQRQRAASGNGSGRGGGRGSGRGANNTDGDGEADDAMEIDADDGGGGGGGSSSSSSSEWECSEEEELVTLDLGPDTQRMVRTSDQYSVTGLETPTPFLQLGSLLFKGRWDKMIGTDILLREEKGLEEGNDDGQGQGQGAGEGEGEGQGGIRPAQSHDVASGPGSGGAGKHHSQLRPLPPSQTNKRRGTAPSTTRHRIQFAQASNLAAKDAALAVHSGGRRKTGNLTHKGYRWVRGYGWVRKEEAVWLSDVIEGRRDVDVGAEEAAAPAAAAAAAAEADPQGQSQVPREHRGIPMAEPLSSTGASGSATRLDKRPAQPLHGPAAPAVASTSQGGGRRGRRPLTEEQKSNNAIWRALLKIHEMRRAKAETPGDGAGNGDNNIDRDGQRQAASESDEDANEQEENGAG